MSEEDKVPSPDGVGVVPEPEPETVRRRPKWLAPVAAGCVLVLLAVGGVAGYRVWSARELAEAKEACAVAADGVRGAANDYNAVVNGQAADASAVAADQVKDVFCQVVIGQCGVSFPSEKAVGFSPVRNWPVIARVLLFHCIRA